jgi:lipopolysaccharide/colanic/teichoic acid biosynthesis glycosyltransferase
MNPVVKQRALSRTATRVFAPAGAASDNVATLTILRPNVQTQEQTDRARRILNVAVAGVALVLVLPLLVVIALLVMFTSKGPVLYTQTRVGINRRRAGSSDGRRRVDFGGRLFKIYKFRTMSVGADRRGEVWASPNDPRVTPVGRVLRKFRLDELPQLFNVLKGDMNLVGPRPEQPKIFANLRTQIDNYAERQRVLPGITGLAQVRHHYDTTVDAVSKKLAFDLQYIDRCSVQEDLKVMLQTVPVVIFQRGAW